MLQKSVRFITCALAVGLSVFALNAVADLNDSGVKIKWGYIGNIGPERWGQLDPSFAACSKGKTQSPINIPKKVKSADTALTINYHPEAASIIKDGSTELMIGTAQTIYNDGHGLQVNFTDTQNPETIHFSGKSYHLVQFHVHTPGETQWHNETFPMEVHLVHQSDDGGVAVVAVFVTGGEPNRALETMLNKAPREKGTERKLTSNTINPGSLLPAKLEYYNFMGSLTTPPCSEGLHWIVLANPITASPAQIVRFKQANNGVNARPVQPLYSRIVNFVDTAK